MTNEESTTEKVAKILLLLLLILCDGMILSYLWQWIMVPLEFPPINIWHAIAIAILISFIRLDINKIRSPAPSLSEVSQVYVYSMFMLLFAWLISFGI